MVNKDDVAQTLKRLRGDRTKAKCAREAGLSPNAWTHYEKARRMPTERIRAQLAKGLGVSLARFEEELLASRDARLGKERAASPSPAKRDDPYQQAIREGLGNIHREFERLFLLMRNS